MRLTCLLFLTTITLASSCKKYKEDDSRTFHTPTKRITRPWYLDHIWVNKVDSTYHTRVIHNLEFVKDIGGKKMGLDGVTVANWEFEKFKKEIVFTKVNSSVVKTWPYLEGDKTRWTIIQLSESNLKIERKTAGVEYIIEFVSTY